MKNNNLTYFAHINSSFPLQNPDKKCNTLSTTHHWIICNKFLRHNGADQSLHDVFHKLLLIRIISFTTESIISFSKLGQESSHRFNYNHYKFKSRLFCDYWNNLFTSAWQLQLCKLDLQRNERINHLIFWYPQINDH